jgi:hypothetical protein
VLTVARVQYFLFLSPLCTDLGGGGNKRSCTIVVKWNDISFVSMFGEVND